MTKSSSSGVKLLALTMVLLASSIVQASDLQSPLTEEEWQLARQVNDYREDNGLATVPVTNSLTKVARTHVADLNTYHPDTATFGTGDCNRHSWSSHGDWTAVCYTGSAQASQMWNKPGRSPRATPATATRSPSGTAGVLRLRPPWVNG